MKELKIRLSDRPDELRLIVRKAISIGLQYHGTMNTPEGYRFAHIAHKDMPSWLCDFQEISMSDFMGLENGI